MMHAPCPYAPRIARLNACIKRVADSKLLNDELRDELTFHSIGYAATLSDLAAGKLKETDAGIREALNVIEQFCILIENELNDMDA